MASPFSIFRKHQRAMIAVLGILCMFAFTFTGFVGGFGSGDGGAERNNPVAVTTRFGDYHESDLREMRYQRDLVKNFLRRAIMLTLDPQMQRFAEPQLAQMLNSQIGPSTESAVLETRILAHEAKRAGVVVSDDSVTDYLREQTADRVRGEEFQSILASMSRGEIQVNRAMLYEALRVELLATKMREMFSSSLQITPAQRWDFYQRLRRRMRVELVSVPAVDFVAKVADPSEGVAQKYFDRYKDQEPQPGSPEPGFKIPHRAAFQYFEAHYQEFYHPEEVSDADVTAYYEKTKDTNYLYNERMDFSEEEEEEAAQEKPANENKPAESNPADKTPADKTPADKTPDDKTPDDKTPDDKAPDDKAPAESKPETEQKEDAKPADGQDEASPSGSSCGADNRTDEEASTDEKPAEEKATDEPPAGDAAPGLSAPKNAAADDQPSAKTDAEPGEGSSKPASKDASEDAKTAGDDSKSSGSESKSAETGSKTAGSGTQLATKKSSAPPLSTRYMLPTSITQGPNPKYEPLWQADPKIRKILAGTKAAEQIEKALAGLKSKLRPYSDALVTWEKAKRKDPNAPRPTPPDFAALAKDKRGITIGRIPLSPDYQIAQVPGIGQSQVAGQPFVAFAVTGLKLFQAVESQDNDGNHYLFWKTADEEARVPSFKEARNEVVQVWKLHEARRPMLERAEQLAKEARGSQKSLKDALATQPGLQVTETPAFSWMTLGSAGQFGQQAPPQMSEVPGTVDIDNAFMRSVFDLQVGDVGVAENHPQTVAYVVRATTSEPPQSVLRDMFLADRLETYLPVVREANGEVYQEWLRNQMQAAKIHWVRPAYDEMRSE